jgi:hypothetical protein
MRDFLLCYTRKYMNLEVISEKLLNFQHYEYIAVPLFINICSVANTAPRKGWRNIILNTQIHLTF